MTGELRAQLNRPERSIIRGHCTTEGEAFQMKEYMKDVSINDAINAGRTDTICWDCKNAMRGGCSWTDVEQQKPVKGWAATGNQEDGYTVYACPEFVRDTYGCGRYRTADDYILALQTALTDRIQQVHRLKRTPNLLRKKNASLVKKVEELEEEIAELKGEEKE